MSNSNGSEDEFFDACDQLDSPKSAQAVFLVNDDGNNEKEDESAIMPTGDLSLDHFDKNQEVSIVTPVEDMSPMKHSLEEEETVVSEDERNSVGNKDDSFEAFIPENLNVEQNIEEAEDHSKLKQNEHNVGNNITVHSDDNLNKVSEIELKDDGPGVEGIRPTLKENSNGIGEAQPNESSTQLDENIEITSKSVGVKPDQVQTSESETNINITESKIQTIERPKSLSVDEVKIPEIIPPSPGMIEKKPKRPPPPRPKGPPPSRPVTKRDSVKSTGKPGKPYISAIDDGLLTPNSTIDNITSEFVEALSKNSPPKKSKTITVPKRKPTSKTNSLSSSLNSNGRDDEVLSSVIVRNLDTGETMPLSSAAEHCLNPLALQIMSRTKEFSFVDENSAGSSGQNSARSSVKAKHNLSDEDVASIASDEITIGGDAEKEIPEHKPGKKKKRIKKFLGKSMIKVKTATSSGMEKAVQKVKQARKHENLTVSSDEESTETSQTIKIKASQSNKGPHMFSKIRQVQDITVHVGAVWSMKFSHCGRLLATAGQDNVIWVWVLSDYHSYFSDMRSRYDTRDTDTLFGVGNKSNDNLDNNGEVVSGSGGLSQNSDEEEAPFQQIPFSSYVGHSADVLDLAWSKNYFILSSSMDKTVRLWHISRKECLCCFQHIDFVTAISFHPRDDRYFLSGSLDGKLRLWNIPEKKVALWNEISSDSASATGGALITTVNFCEHGKFAVCGTYDGRCIFYETEHFKYHTQIHVRSSRGRNNKGHKITGIEALPGEHKLLVTSNDSRIRLYDLRDLSMTCKYKGLTNLSSQIKASFSHDLKYIICGSEDKCVYVWPTNVPQDVTKLSSLRRDRNDCWENLKAHNAVVTCAIFAPKPDLLIKKEPAPSPEPKETKLHSFMGTTKKPKVATCRVLISADFNGEIKVFVTE